MYGEHLKTDILQVAHHGYGGTVELYALFQPSAIFWPLHQSGVNSQLRPGATSYYPVINQSLVNQKNVLLVVVCDGGHKVLTLPLKGLLDDTNRDANYNKFVTVLPREDGNK